jgi:amino acid transporter
MAFTLLDIPVLFGVSIEVYFILIILGTPAFFIWRRIFKKYIKVDRTRKIWTWAATLLLTPMIYVGLVMIWVFSISYYPNHDFDKQKWGDDLDKRYELSKDIIDSKMLIGKSKAQVRQILGNEDNSDSLNTWVFGLGVRPELFNIDDSYLQVEFDNGKVVNVEQHK